MNKKNNVKSFQNDKFQKFFSDKELIGYERWILEPNYIKQSMESSYSEFTDFWDLENAKFNKYID